ncbi:MAG TPA: alpha/beta hydrolase [Acidocella sp.]|jgi:monoterpene epsilon-lactone hydrolase|uniref:alpha/beta hydrolase n=1 Tax=Acidocella sp. TaxID=50710 RepID=UPI002B900800|nr:alpha/beta hydrolase [Acidocella sp.]HVE20937.1 alpha/beta hydrolase [Acidocella sp.]
MHKRDSARAFAAAAFMLLAPAAMAQTTLAPRDVPAKTIPVPGDVSPQLQAVIARPLSSGWNTPPTTPQGWKQLSDTLAAGVAAQVGPMAQRLHVKIEPATIDGVKVYRLTPETIPARNAKRLLIHVHGGCYVLSGGEAALPEALLMAGISHIRVISVDYRMPPTAYFPAALDDAMTVYKAELKTTNPKDLGVFGRSAGGALTLEMMLRIKQEHLPMPAAIAVNTPMADMVDEGDSSRTNALVDNVLVAPDEQCDAAARFYAHGHDMADPMISPLLGDFHGFPPTIMATGTRDLMLSNTVRTHQKLLQSGVPASLLVFEGMSHAQFSIDDRIPEDRQAFTEEGAFMDQHLGH